MSRPRAGTPPVLTLDKAEPNLLDVANVTKTFGPRRKLSPRGPATAPAVDRVSFHIGRHETFGLVGESGCGKTTLGRMILRLEEPTSGQILVDGVDVLRARGRGLRSLRRRVQVVFQDPLGSLDPRMTVGASIAEILTAHKLVPSSGVIGRIEELLTLVGLDPLRRTAFPRQLSGGQRQRVGIARALAVEPELIVADEPVSALDVSVQAQIINLLVELQERTGVSYLFIAHGLGAVRQISHRVGVMYLGAMMEIADVDTIFAHASHPYTVGLLSAVPSTDPNHQSDLLLRGELPVQPELLSGCRFRARCPFARSKCQVEEPALEEQSSGHWVACHFPC